MLDILQIDRGSNVALFRNLGAQNDGGEPLPMGNWTEIRLVEPNPNRDAVGAHIAVKTGTRTQVRTIEIGGGDASGHAGWVHVGLGTAERAEIRVQWPDGEWSYPYRVFANQFVVVDRDKTAGGILVSGAVGAKRPARRRLSRSRNARCQVARRAEGRPPGCGAR